MAEVGLFEIPDFAKITKEAAAPRFTGAGLAAARAICPVLNVSESANVAINNRRTELLSG
jgi:hypothetical protein